MTMFLSVTNAISPVVSLPFPIVTATSVPAAILYTMPPVNYSRSGVQVDSPLEFIVEEECCDICGIKTTWLITKNPDDKILSPFTPPCRCPSEKSDNE